jgi:SP family sugar:H+ symporter-like MFS transporter
LYIADCAPATLRGALTGAWQFSLGIGHIIGTATVYATQKRTDSGSYLIPMTVQAIMPLFLIAACVFILPESPRWLADKGNMDKARQSLVRLAGTTNAGNVDKELEFITESVEESHRQSKGSWKELFKPGPESRKLMITVGMAAWNQAGGINLVVSYGAVILNSFGTTLAVIVLVLWVSPPQLSGSSPGLSASPFHTFTTRMRQISAQRSDSSMVSSWPSAPSGCTTCCQKLEAALLKK